jgi:LacI family transcriptional regulator
MAVGGKVTLSEIARRADTSTMAVSVVLNGARSNTRVSETTRHRILSIAAELNYSPNAMAQGLKRQRAQTVGVLFSWAGSRAVHDLYSATVLDGIMNAAGGAGYHVLLYSQPWRGVAESGALFTDRRADGVIVVAPRDDSDVTPGLIGLGLKIALLSSVTDVTGVPSVNIDNRAGIRLALDHLKELGHERIAYAGHAANRYSMRERYEAYRDWMAENGFACPDDYVITGLNRPDAEDNRGDWERLFRHPNCPTAICATNDDVAVRILEVARANGISVPDQLSVTGFDDILVASLTVPKLTTVRQPLFDMGRHVAQLLIASVEGRADETPTQVIVPPELIRRDSTAPPAAR